MEKLIKFIESRYAYAQVNSDRFTREIFFHQAFGAIEFYLMLHPEHEDTVKLMWENTYTPKFKALIGRAIR